MINNDEMSTVILEALAPYTLEDALAKNDYQFPFVVVKSNRLISAGDILMPNTRVVIETFGADPEVRSFIGLADDVIRLDLEGDRPIWRLV